MRALIFERPGRISLATVPDAMLLAPGDALVRARRVGRPPARSQPTRYVVYQD